MIDTRAELQPGSPDSVGMSPDVLKRAADLLASEVEQGRISAASIFVARKKTIVLSKGFGRLTPEAGSEPVDRDSVFLIASITKPVTGCTMMMLVDEGKVALDDPVSKYIPEFEGGERGKVLVRNLLTHTSGLPDMLPENVELRRANAPLDDFVKGATKTPLLYSPNTNFRYQSKGILLAA